MTRFSKILIILFSALVLSFSFAIFHFSQAGKNNVLASNISNFQNSEETNPSSESSVYICPNATSLEEVNPRCPGKINLELGETINGMTLTSTTHNGQEYYLVFGFENGGGGVNLPPKANANGPYKGYGGLPITFDASNSSDPNDDPLQYRWDFNNDGIWDTEWLNEPKTGHIWNNDYDGIAKLEVSDGQFTVAATTSVEVISPRTFKEETIEELKAVKTGDKEIDKRIEQIIKHIENSLKDELWIDRSHLVFFKKDCFDQEMLNLEKIDLEKLFEAEPDEMEEKCFGPKNGLRVFHEEYIAAKLIFEELRGKPKIQEEIKSVLKEIVAKLVKADELLVKVALYDAKNTSIENPKFTKLVEHQIAKAEEELIKAEEELAKNRPDKAIMRFGKSWLHAQLVIKLANWETRP